MNRKIFTILLLVMFMLAQFSAASAAQVTADGTIVGPSFMNDSAGVIVNIDWTANSLPAGTTYVDIYARLQGSTYDVLECRNVAVIIGTSSGSGIFGYTFTGLGLDGNPTDGETWEFLLAFDNTASCATLPANPADVDTFMSSTYVDGQGLYGFYATQPYDGAAIFGLQPVACNTFENWALVTDHPSFSPFPAYSGFGSWNPQITGTFAPPAPIGSKNELLSWSFTFPSTASGTWSITIDPEDIAGNTGTGPYYFRLLSISPTELADCETFSDIGGHADETYIRYLATLGLISGFADGTFGPDATLTRAEAATLIEISNGYDETTLPTSAPAGCDFTDVAAADWFAGWVWQACDDGYMNGVGGGLFDPGNQLTRGQIVTILNNVAESTTIPGGFLATNALLYSAFTIAGQIRDAAWTDVPIGAYYAEPVVEAYGWGIAEGTSETTFSPDEPVTRGVFAKMLYRALSRYDFIP